MQQKLRCELSDRSAKLFHSRHVGRVLVEVVEEKLSVFLDNLPKEKRDPYAWSQGKEEMQTEICEEVGCQHTQAEHSQMMRTLQQNLEQQRQQYNDIKWDLVWKNGDLEKLEKELAQAKAEAKQCSEVKLALECKNPDLERLTKDLEQERAEAKKLKMTLTNVFQSHLQHQIDARKAAKIMQVSHKAQLDASIAETEKLKAALNRSEDQCLCLQQERNVLLKEKEKSSKVLEARDQQSNARKTALKELEQRLERSKIYWQEEKSSLLQETDVLKETLRQKEQESNKKERDLTSQLEETQRARASSKAQAKEQEKESNTLLVALKETLNQLESSQIHWQEDKTSLLQETDVLKETLRQKEQVWEEKESALTAQLDDLKSQIGKKKNKKKWFRRLFSC